MLVRTVVVLCGLALSGCGGRVERSSSEPRDSGLSQSMFQFPADGQTGQVGPFCCSGRTVTVRARDGAVLGYAYFYDFGPAYNQGDTSYSTSFAILVADAEGNERRIEFEAKDVYRSDTGSAQVGELVFVVMVTHVDLKSSPDQRVFDMGTLTVELSVETT